MCNRSYCTYVTANILLTTLIWASSTISNWTSGFQSTTAMSAIEHFPCNCAKIGNNLCRNKQDLLLTRFFILFFRYKYLSRDLRGLKVNQDQETFSELKTIILALKHKGNTECSILCWFNVDFDYFFRV